MGGGSPGRLVRSLRRPGRRAHEAVCVCLAQHGEWSGLPLRFFECHAAGFPGSSRAGFCLVRRGLSSVEVRQSDLSREEDRARTAAGRDGTIHCLPLAWRFAAEFCTPAEAHEKGGIESEAGYFRRNHWVPVPQAADLADLNRQLAAACRQDEQRTISGRSQSIGAALRVERPYLLPRASEGMDLAHTSFPTVNGLGCAKVRTNSYSVPLPAGTELHAKPYSGTVEVRHQGS